MTVPISPAIAITAALSLASEPGGSDYSRRFRPAKPSKRKPKDVAARRAKNKRARKTRAAQRRSR